MLVRTSPLSYCFRIRKISCSRLLRYTRSLFFVYRFGKLFSVEMEITFADDDLRTICENPAQASKRLGPSLGKKLISRLKLLRAANNISDLQIGSPHPVEPHKTGGTKFRKRLKGYQYLYSLDLDRQYRLVFQSIEDPQPLKVSGEINWLKVTKICIVFLGDYHE
jgi:proteic killer suppression protein